ncbi:Hypothetical protein NTJ_11751 [Nesidiocoris tenuis]|uniref:Ribosomal protein eL8/eL30/eS12/Gadd45 domain-containing protein n=1 Tax=Nesidiocoris tenuis TaxID=355587 RepID=A0ABN7B3F6_9HEMI|nr:Hypothetical protein NTJ_11751 [Nesidiocoris tenuis]
MEKSLNFRKVVVGSSDSGSAKPSQNRWPKLGDRSNPKKVSLHSDCMTQNVELPRISAEGIGKLNASEFPTLGKKADVRLPSRNPQKNENSTDARTTNKNQKGALQSMKKKKIKHSSPFLVDICDIIQMSALKTQRKCNPVVPAVKKSSKTRRKVITGNRLDSEAPKRLHKGKCREWKPRFMSKTKKTFCASWKIRVSRIPFSREMLKFKEDFGQAMKSGPIDVEGLASKLSVVDLDGGGADDKESRNVPTPDEETASNAAKDIIHNKKFRPYCTNIVTCDLKENAARLVETLRRFQDRAHAKDEIKARMRKRYVCGFRESKKFLAADRVKMLIVATNLDILEGLPSMAILNSLTELANEKEVPVVFAGSAQNIAYWSMKKGKISVLAVMNYEGADDLYQRVLTSWSQAKSDYSKLLGKLVENSSKVETPSVEPIGTSAEEKIAEVLLNELKDCLAEKPQAPED